MRNEGGKRQAEGAVGKALMETSSNVVKEKSKTSSIVLVFGGQAKRSTLSMRLPKGFRRREKPTGLM